MSELLFFLLSQTGGGNGATPAPEGPFGACGGGGLGGLIPLVIMFVIFYALLIYPQQKKAKQHRSFLSSLKRGDDVITDGGIYGRITGLTDQFVTLEVAEKVRIKLARSRIAGLQGGERPEEKAGK